MGLELPKHHRLTLTPMQLRQDVVILGTGAFALEAMEAADRGGARSLTLIARPRDRQEQTSPVSHISHASGSAYSDGVLQPEIWQAQREPCHAELNLS